MSPVFIFLFAFYALTGSSGILLPPSGYLQDEAVIDCNYTFEEALEGIKIPEAVKNKLTIVDVEYYSFDDRLHRGQIVIHKAAARDIREIFEYIRDTKFPIGRVIPVVKYSWSDIASMNDNNTSAFNYRKVAGQKVLSAHSKGMAIDINPVQNPHIRRNTAAPQNAVYDERAPGTILKNSGLLTEFRKRGWQWGGAWRSSRDYQHFEKK